MTSLSKKSSIFFMAVFAAADYAAAYFLILDGSEKKHLKEIWNSVFSTLSRPFVKTEETNNA